MPDYDRLRYEELASISALIHGLPDDQWDSDTLCSGWRVRDVIGHLVFLYTTPLTTLVAKFAKQGFNNRRFLGAEAVAYGSSHTPAQIKSEFDSIAIARKGVGRFGRPQELLLDALVHEQDIRRPLGLPHQIPEERLLAALNVSPLAGTFIGAKKWAEGFHLVATDVNWSHGEGPDVHGTGEAILLVRTGRTVVLDELTGDGVATLRARLST